MRRYRTSQGDTWDLIAYRMYPFVGKENLMSRLIEQNPDYADTVIFPAGVIIYVPEISKPEQNTLPPWKS